ASDLTLPGNHTMKALKSQRLVQGLDRMKIEPRKIDELLSFRSYHWFAALQAIKDSPVFGHGLGTFDKLYKNYKTPRDGYKSAFAHNLYLDYWVEMGLPGLFISIFFFVFSVFLAWRLWSNECCGKHVRSLALGLMTAQLSIALGNLFSSSLYYVTELMFLQSVFLAMLASLFNSVYPSKEGSLAEKAASWTATLKNSKVCRFGAAAACVVIFGIFLVLCQRSAKKGEAQYYSCEPYDNLGRMLEYGILHYEYDQYSNKFARTRHHVYRPLQINSRYLLVYLRASHPDADLKPVPASFSINGKLAGSCVISNRTWNTFVIDAGRIVPVLTNEELAASGKKIPINLEMISGRMWNPLDWNPQEQNIKYGVDLGTILQGLF
ncbi:O-antigen ligase family protein, partial [bacterium]|nr:O-antigen ligase family protein [bacterium]